MIPDFFNYHIFSSIHCEIRPINSCRVNRRKVDWFSHKWMWGHIWVQLWKFIVGKFLTKQKKNRNDFQFSKKFFLIRKRIKLMCNQLCIHGKVITDQSIAVYKYIFNLPCERCIIFVQKCARQAWSFRWHGGGDAASVSNKKRKWMFKELLA